jgi:hypothetical protein
MVTGWAGGAAGDSTLFSGVRAAEGLSAAVPEQPAKAKTVTIAIKNGRTLRHFLDITNIPP